MLAGESVTDRIQPGPGSGTAGPRRRANIATGLRAGIDAGEIRLDVDCAALAAKIAAMMNGLELQWLLDPDSQAA